ncbi:MAG: relaxase/mobilization nuclease domain-containing protein [Methanobacteriaceae archaeon]|nr:relaxase/mobilization nuclease domain-containing protein [Methanobacteriaceae archaeon]
MLYKIIRIYTDPADKLHYANDKAILNDTYNMVCTGSSSIEEKIQEFAWLASFNEHMGEGYRQAYQHIISPTEQYTEPEKLIRFGREFLDKEYPNCQATLSVHNDNKSRRYHLHIIMNAVRTDFYKINVKKKESVRKAYYLVHDLAKQYGLDPATKELLEKRSEDKKKQVDYGCEKNGRKSIRVELKEIVNECLRNVRSFSHFEARLRAKGVKIIRWMQSVNVKGEDGNFKYDENGKIVKEKVEQIKYEYKGKIFRPRSLGERYNKESVEKAIEKSLLHQKEVLYKKITYKIDHSYLVYNVRNEFYEKVKWMYEDRNRPLGEIVALLYKLLVMLIIVLKAGLHMGKEKSYSSIIDVLPSREELREKLKKKNENEVEELKEPKEQKLDVNALKKKVNDESEVKHEQPKDGTIKKDWHDRGL